MVINHLIGDDNHQSFLRELHLKHLKTGCWVLLAKFRSPLHKHHEYSWAPISKRQILVQSPLVECRRQQPHRLPATLAEHMSSTAFRTLWRHGWSAGDSNGGTGSNRCIYCIILHPKFHAFILYFPPCWGLVGLCDISHPPSSFQAEIPLEEVTTSWNTATWTGTAIQDVQDWNIITSYRSFIWNPKKTRNCASSVLQVSIQIGASILQDQGSKRGVSKTASD